MSGDWIKFRKSLLNDGRVKIVKRKCNASSVTVIGALVTLWSLADDYADESGQLYGYTSDDINEEIGIENFCESLPGEWIDLTGEWVKLPDYQEHNGSTAKKRAVTHKRVQNHRKCNAPNVTKALPEKRREEKIIKESKQRKVFTKPTIEQIKKHIQEKSYQVDADKFLNHYESNGWKVGRNPMKSWTAALANWNKNPFGDEKKKPERKPYARPEDIFYPDGRIKPGMEKYA